MHGVIKEFNKETRAFMLIGCQQMRVKNECLLSYFAKIVLSEGSKVKR